MAEEVPTVNAGQNDTDEYWEHQWPHFFSDLSRSGDCQGAVVLEHVWEAYTRPEHWDGDTDQAGADCGGAS